MSEEQKHIDELFREELGGYAETPPAQVWEALEKRLDDDDGRRGGGGIPPRRWLWYALALVLLSTLATIALKKYWGKETETARSERSVEESAGMNEQMPDYGMSASTEEGSGINTGSAGNESGEGSGEENALNNEKAETEGNKTSLNEEGSMTGEHSAKKEGGSKTSEEGITNKGTSFSEKTPNKKSTAKNNTTAKTKSAGISNQALTKESPKTKTEKIAANDAASKTTVNKPVKNNKAAAKEEVAVNKTVTPKATNENAVSANKNKTEQSVFNGENAVENEKPVKPAAKKARAANAEKTAISMKPEAPVVANTPKGNTEKASVGNKKNTGSEQNEANPKPITVTGENRTPEQVTVKSEKTTPKPIVVVPEKNTAKAVEESGVKPPVKKEAETGNKEAKKNNIEVASEEAPVMTQEEKNEVAAKVRQEEAGNEEADKEPIEVASEAFKKKELKVEPEAAKKNFLKMDNYESVEEDISESTGGGGGGGGAEEEDNDREKKKNKNWEFGVKAGYETAFGADKTNKYVLAPFVSYNMSKKVAVTMMPGFKYGNVAVSSLGQPTSYYNITGSNFNSSFVIGQDSAIVPPNVGIDTITYTYNYSQAYDSIRIGFNIQERTAWEVELPILLSYKLAPNFSVYGGPVMNVASIVQLREERQAYSLTKNASTTFAPIIYPDSASIPSGPPRANYEDIFSYSGTPYSQYNPAQFSNNVSTLFRFGYMAGFSYAIKDRFLIDVLMQQSLARPAQIPNEKIRSIYAQPYFRIMLGYKFGKKKP